MSAPFADAGQVYLSKGWGPFPLPERKKAPPPTGWTGYGAPYPSGADVAEWAANGTARGNIGLRLPETVIGIDVDAYGDKPGLDTRIDAEDRLGQLPQTYRSTARGGFSGIYLYRVPAGRRWADVVGPGVEVIHHGHRYMVAAPSIHPSTGEPYRWYGPDGRQCAAPRVEDLPELPEAWVRELDRGDVSEVAAKADLTLPEVQEFLDELPNRRGDPCPYLQRVLEAAELELASAASRHDTVRGYVARVIRGGEQGHEGAELALTMLGLTWRHALETGEKRPADHGEWERMVAGAVGIVLADPTPAVDKGCCGGSSTVELPDSMLFTPVDREAFWNSRPVLSHVRTFARARMCSPWSVLGVVLARQVTVIKPSIVLPAIIGSHASLNLFVALVGTSGMGKGTSESAAADCIDFRCEVETATVGSGEGIGHLYAHREKGEVVRDRESVLFTVPEIDNLSALGARQGATLLPQLRMAWSGETLGFSYADPTKRLPIKRHTYRMGLVLGVQPGRAEGLLADADGGTPQRFVWMPTTDPDAPEDLPECPEPYRWEGLDQTWFYGPGGLAVMQVPDVARQTILEAHRARLRGTGEALDGHALLARLKVAAALALLDCRGVVNEEDWELATTVMAVSDATRESVIAHVASQAVAANAAKGKAEAARAVAVQETLIDAQVKRVSRVLLRGLSKRAADDLATSRDCKALIASRDRDVLEDALLALEQAGQVERLEHDDKVLWRVVS